MLKILADRLKQCTEDMRYAAGAGHWEVDAAVRAYDLMEMLSDIPDVSAVSAEAEAFVAEYETLKDGIGMAYDETSLRQQVQLRLEPLEQKLEQERQKAEVADDLHRCAVETFDIWQRNGIIARYRALRTLRRKAGFRLESARIGNYVAKTFDLMNEARASYARAQQELFAADVAYKINPEIYGAIAGIIR